MSESKQKSKLWARSSRTWTFCSRARSKLLVVLLMAVGGAGVGFFVRHFGLELPFVHTRLSSRV